MRWLILLQSLSALAYYVTAPFALTLGIWLMLAINVGMLAVLWVSCTDTSSPLFRLGRWGFTVSVILLEVVIGMTDSPISNTELQGIINDAEVLFTGVLLGVLWHKLFTNDPKTLSA